MGVLRVACARPRRGSAPQLSRREHAGEGAEAEDPAAQRPVVSDVSLRTSPPSGRSSSAATVPHAIPDVAAYARLEGDLDVLGRALIDAERMGERRLRQRLSARSAPRSATARDAVDRERPQLVVFGHEREEIQPALREHQPLRLDHVVLLAVARQREVASSSSRRWWSVASSSCAMCSRVGFAAAGAPGRAATPGPLRLDHQRQAIEELPHARRERRRQLVERVATSCWNGVAARHFDQRPAEIQRAQLREREAGVVEPPERLASSVQ